MNLEMLEIISPALIAGLLISLTHGLLGLKVLQRGIIFIDLAIAQIAGLGLILASLLFPEHHFSHQLIALLFALTSGIFFNYIEKKCPDIQEAIIGCTFVVSASLSMLLLVNHSHSGDEIKHLLSGQILLTTMQDIAKHFPIYAILTTLWLVKPKLRNGISFYLIFALAITSSVQLVGIYVVFASLILPAIAAINSTRPILIVWSCGIISILLGIISAVIFDFPAGSLIVISYAIVTIIFQIIIREKN